MPSRKNELLISVGPFDIECFVHEGLFRILIEFFNIFNPCEKMVT